jgi:hypothetical protein
MLRRSLLGFTPDQGQSAIDTVARELGRLFRWGTERIANEQDVYLSHIALTQRFRQEL